MENDPDYWEVPTAPQFESVDGDYVDISDIEYDRGDESDSALSLEDLDEQWFPTDAFRLDDADAPAGFADFDAVVRALAALVSDYRADELGAGWIDEDRIREWVAQFGLSPDLQQALLGELLHVLRQTYLPVGKIEEFYRRAVRHRRVTGGLDPAEFWAGAHLIDFADQTFLYESKGIARWGQSRALNTKRFRSVIQQEVGVGPEDDPERAHTFIYVDDLMCSGWQAVKEISAWMADYGAHQAPRVEKDVVLIVAAKHTGSDDWVRETVRQCRGVATVRGLCAMSIESRLLARDESDVYWPKIPDPSLRADVEASFNGVRWRTRDSCGRMGLYSSIDARSTLESALLRAGMELSRPYLDGRMTRPMGSSHIGIGLGTPIVTSENCPNLAPLALWMETPKWMPLFPRRGRQIFEGAEGLG